MMETQLQIYLIIGVGSFLLAALILSNSLLIYYLSKLYKRHSSSEENYQTTKQETRNVEDPPQINAHNLSAYINPSMNFEEELNRRFTQYTPDTTMQRDNTKANKGTDSSKNIKNVIDVSEEFRWKKTESSITDSRLNDRTASQYNSNIVLKNDDFISDHEGRTSFN